MCRSRRELSNEYLLAKIGVDTAENEPLKVWGKIFNIIQTDPNSIVSLVPFSIFSKFASTLSTLLSVVLTNIFANMRAARYLQFGAAALCSLSWSLVSAIVFKVVKGTHRRSFLARQNVVKIRSSLELIKKQKTRSRRGGITTGTSSTEKPEQSGTPFSAFLDRALRFSPFFIGAPPRLRTPVNNFE